jgi:type I restriction enzyme R subunit
MMPSSVNFGFLSVHAPQLVRLGALAERYFGDDPNTCIMKLRQFGEVMAQMTAACLGVYTVDDDRQIALLTRLRDDAGLTKGVLDLFHQLRRSGNDATHALHDDHGTALTNLKVAHRLAIWFHRSFGQDRAFQAPTFVPPANPVHETEALRQELEDLRRALTESQAAAAQEANLRLSAEEERTQWAALAQEAEEAKADLLRQLNDMQATATAQPAAEIRFLAQTANDAAEQIDLDEADTRRIVDAQLRASGWEADSDRLTFKNGVRPHKGKNLAIAEWPTSSGPADYVLFVGLQAVGVVEAKRKRKDVSAAVDQAKRYSRDFVIQGDETLPQGGPWQDKDGHAHHVPFVFATNGRPYLKQVETKSGIWFCDVRRPTNLRRALEGWYTPQGLVETLKQDIDESHERLKNEDFNYGIDLRDYQRNAIRRIEEEIGKGRRTCLLAMATGTGKTATCIALVYRLLKTRRFRRILFVVDRSALGTQAADAFKSTRMENLQTFANIFGIKELGDVAPDPDTRVHIATVQGLVKRVLYTEDETAIPAVDQYDCIVVDECHRGYLLDREMSDAELTFRDQSDYISKYRRVLEHFDAVKVGLTATPALHTVDIFGEPIFQYSYREAVIDGWLIDHEPPYRIVTALAEDGIEWKAGDDMEVVNTRNGQLDLIHLGDDVRMEVEDFNRKVVTENFNRVVCEELARHLDPALDGKTLVFCANDAHADLVVNELKKAFAARYGSVDDDAVLKITGASDKPQQLIRRYRNEGLPNVAVTVDLLTTGIDVPKICNLVFIRRVNSRILYEQMLGRATRRCDEIGKEVFRIFDAVDLYRLLQDMTTMRPVVVNPKLSFRQLADDLATQADETIKAQVKDEIVAKLRRTRRHIPEGAARRIEAMTGLPLARLPDHLNALSPEQVAEWFARHPNLADLLDWREEGPPPLVAISDHEDKLRRLDRGYGQATRPDDYLDGFRAFLTQNLNKVPALLIVTQRPRDLTRQQLKELRLLLDQHGYSEQNLRTAWQQAKNEDIAASIIGFVRQAALGDPLVPYEQRVDRAIKTILAGNSWTAPQRQWLTRIGEQLRKEVVVDKEALDHGAFAGHGGFTRLNRIFDGRLEAILSDINEALWKGVG